MIVLKLRNRRLGRIQRKSLSSESESSHSEHPDESSDEKFPGTAAWMAEKT
jgi:hypothetical protein